MRISDWSSDVCSSDLLRLCGGRWGRRRIVGRAVDGQIDGEAGPFARLAVGKDETRRLLDDAIDGRQAEPGALADILGGEEGLEKLGEHVGGNAGARVAEIGRA